MHLPDALELRKFPENQIKGFKVNGKKTVIA
jgi:hypothetical protein